MMRLIFSITTFWVFVFLMLTTNANAQQNAPRVVSYEGGDNDGYSRTTTNFGMSINESLLTVCEGEDVVVSAVVKGEGIYLYKWARLNDVGGIISDSSSCAFKRITTGSAGKYYCEVTDRRGSVSFTDTVEIKVFTMPTVSIEGRSRMAKGDSVELKVNGSADEFLWSSGSKEITLWVKPVTSTTYMVTGKNGGLCAKSASIDIEVTDLYVRSQGNVYAIQHESVTLKVETNADQVDWYEKQPSTSRARAVTNEYGTFVDTGKVIVVTPLLTTEYTALATFEGVSRATVLTVLVRDNRFYKGGDNDGYTRTASDFSVTTSASPAIACEDVPVVLTAVVKGESQYKYEWTKVGSATIFKDTSCLNIAQAAITDAGKYVCKVTDARLNVWKYDTVELTVNKRAIAAIVVPSGQDTLICYGDTISLYGTFSNSSAATLKWHAVGGGATIFGDATDFTINVSPSVDTKFVLTADNAGCSTTDTLEVKVSRPEVFLDDQLRITEGSNATLLAKDASGNALNGANLKWYKDYKTSLGSGNPMVIPAITKSMVVSVDYKSGSCVVTDSIHINVKGAQAFRGGNNDGYTRTCQPPLILQQKGMDRAQCVAAENSSLQIIAEGTRIKYEWQKWNSYSGEFEAFVPSAGSQVEGQTGPTLTFKKLVEVDNGSYRCVLTNNCSNGDVISDTFHVAAKGEPTIASGIHDRYECMNAGPLLFNIVAKSTTSGTPLTYQWYKDGVAIPDETLPFYNIHVAPNNYKEVQGLYKVVVKTECGSVADSARLVTDDIPVIKSQSDSIYVCQGNTGTLWVKTEISGDYTYSLYELSAYSELATKTLIYQGVKNQWNGVVNAGFYRWNVTNKCDAKGVWSQIMYVKTEQTPTFLVQPRDTVLCEKQTLKLECVGQSSGQKVKYIWYKDGMLLKDVAETGTLTIYNVEVKHAGLYQCEIFNSCTPVKSVKVRVTVKQPPMIISSPDLYPDYCIGSDSIILKTSLAAGRQVDSLRWFYKGYPIFDEPNHIVGTTTPEMKITNPTAEDAKGFYFLRAYGACGIYAESKPVSFELQYPARFIRGFDGNVKLHMCAGENQTLMVEVDPKSTAPVRYKWLHNKDEVANGTSNSLTITDVDLDEKGKYTCQVQNKCGNDQTEAYIQVHRPDTFRFEGGGRYCENGEGVSARLVGSDSSVVYQLYRENPKTLIGEPIDGTTIDPLFGPINYTKLKVGTYFVTGRDTNLCEFTMPGKVVVTEDKVPMNFDLSVSRYICAGQKDGDLKLNGSEKGVVYYLCEEKNFGGWDTIFPGQPGNGLALQFLNIPVGTYRVIAKSTASNCWRDLSGIEKMKEQPLPLYTGLKFANLDSVYCRNATSDVALVYDFAADHKYRLKKNGVDFGAVQATAPLNWKPLDVGSYSIEVSNEWGCKATFGSKIVTAQNPPNVHQLIGRKYFCSTDKDTNTLELLTSDAGVRYSFRFKPGTHYKDTLSQGGAIRLKIPLIERDYYVIAIDTTKERCETAMRDTISWIKSRIKINPVSPVVVGYGDTIRLEVKMTGYVGKLTDLVYTWGNIPMLAESNKLPSPLTHPITTTQIFPIMVQDLSGCVDNNDVVVNVTGGELSGEIRLSDCNTSAPDTMTICRGDSLFFCSVASGGVSTDTYHYQWWDDNKSDLDTTFRLENYLKNTTGYLHWKVVNGSQTVRDSVWVVVNPSPSIDTIENAGIQCVQLGGAINIVLKSSDVGALYRLECKVPNGSYATLGVAQNGTGGPLTYSIANSSLIYAKYRIIGTMSNTGGVGMCERLMHGEVDVREASKPFNVIGAGGYCKGVVPVDTITLVGSETGVNYSLLKIPSTLKDTKSGTSNALEFIGNFEAGKYRVLAVKGDCRDTMPGIVEIEEYALPTVDTLVGAGQYCSKSCPIEIGVTPGLKNIEYTLLVDTLNGGVGTSIFYGEGHLVFGHYCVLGTYKVRSRDTLTGCVTTTTDSVTITDTPTPFFVDQDGFVCSSSSTASVALSLRGAKENVIYNLYATPGDRKMGEFKKLPGSLPFPVGDTLWFTGALSLGNYVVEAQVGDCTLRSTDTIKIQSGKGIDQPKMSILTEACEGAGAGLAIDMSSSMEGVRYTLYQKGNPEIIISNLMGTGSGVSFPQITNIGTYYIMAVDTQSLCSRKLMPEYKIEKKPQPFNMTGDTTYCEDDDGVVIGLDGKELGMTYTLQRKNDLGEWVDVSNILTAHGAGGVFSGKYKQGIYRVLAGTVCKVEMSNTLDVRPVKHPNKLIVKRQGMACVDSTMTLVVDGTVLGETYTLFEDNVAVVGGSQPGGATLTWNIAPLVKSVYTIKTTIAGCSVTLDSAVNVGKTPTLNQLEGDSIYCAGLEGKIFVNNNESGVRYDLYVMPMDTLFKRGVAVGGNTVFEKLKAGSYYVVASAGDCKVKNNAYKIREQAKPANPQWEMNDCVATDSGRITIKNRMAQNVYVLDGIAIAPKMFKKTTGNTTLTKLPLGIYTLQVQDTLSKCSSDLLTDTIREGVYQDSLVRSFEYCIGTAGAKLEMSNVRSGVDYQIRTPMGNVIETISRPVKLFSRDYSSGHYVFRKTRTGYLGGCYEDKVFTIKSRVLPKKKIAVTLNGVAPICAGSGYSVTLQMTEVNMRYLLKLDGATANIDTLYGNGTAQTFGTKIKAAGRYKVMVSDTVVFCSVGLDTTLTIHPLPRAVIVDSCSYCQVAGDPLVGCDIHLKGMQPSVKYMLNGATCTLLGNGTGKFSKLTIGVYSVIMTDTVTGCVDTVKTSVKQDTAPHRFTLGGGCGSLLTVSSVGTIDGSEGNGVTYQLYKDGSYTGFEKFGDGTTNVVFSNIVLPGTYKIRAYNASTGCATFMADSVVIHEELAIDGGNMTVVGSFCDGTDDGVRLEYPVSTKGWRYYITNGVFYSDTLSGYGGKLTFSKINGGAIQNGVYDLCALSPCNGKQLLATVTVTAKPLPALYSVSPTSPHSLCTDATFQIVLGGSELGVTYTVTRYNTSNIYVEKYAPVMGGTSPLSLGTYGHAGFYEIVGSNGCERVLDRIFVKKGNMPTEYDIVGADKCLTAGGTSQIQIGLPSREANITYYLHLNGGAIPIDTLNGAPLTQLKFKDHSSLGCYTVVGVHAASGCSLPMRGTFCMSTPPNKYNVISILDTVELCFGSEHCIEISDSDIGIQYELMLGSNSYGKAVAGTGDTLKVGCVEDPGKYKVIAKVGTCQETMNDSVIVRVNPVPELILKPTYNFCEGKAGVQIEIGAPTDPNIQYTLQDPAGTVIETISGEAGHGGTSFVTSVVQSGVYKVIASNPVSGCSTLDTTLVTEEKLPTGYDLVSSNGKYICDGGHVTLTLKGSEPGVTYELVKDPDLATLETRIGATAGGSITFSYKVTSPGTYKVRARNGFGLNCETYFNSITLIQAPMLNPYPLGKINSSYCSTGSGKGSILLTNSDVGIEYELQKDGRLTGIIQGGTGGALTWNNLEGKACMGNDLDGYEYRIVARDTMTKCTRNMLGSDTIMAVDPLIVLSYMPNEAYTEKCGGDFIRFNMTVSGCRATYTWYHDASVIKSGKDEYYNIDSIQPNDAGTYWCEVTNACNKVEMPKSQLQVRPLVVLAEPMQDVYICDNKPRDVMLTSGFKNATNFTWYKAEKPDSVLGYKAHLEFPQFKQEQSGKYVCRAENGCNPPGYDTCVVTYSVLPDITFSKVVGDTICSGGPYAFPQLTVNNVTSIRWMLDGNPLSFTGTRYILNNVQASDAGTYTVVAANTCGVTQPILIGRLWVDSLLTLDGHSDTLMMRCIGESQELYVNVSPAERVHYRWEDLDKPIGYKPIGYTPKLQVGPFDTISQRTYRIWYWNKCSTAKFKDIIIHIPKKFDFGDTGGTIVTCADNATDTVIRLNMGQSVMAEYKWYVQYAQDTTQKTLLSTADSVIIPRNSGNSGYYYCNVFNRCYNTTTQTWWVRVDSIPVIQNTLQDDSVCINGWTKITLPATGGGLTYNWHILKKGSVTPEIRTFKDKTDNFESVGELMLSEINMTYDSCLIWCLVGNTCGSDASDTMMLRVIPSSEISIEPMERVCEGAEGRFLVTLTAGETPWSYTYRHNGVDSLRSAITATTDTIKTTKTGLHRIISLEDNRGCRRTGNLGEAQLEVVPKSYVALTLDKDSICQGEEVVLSIQVSAASIGPWKLEIRQESDGSIASNVTNSSTALPLARRDTSFTFKPLVTESYYAQIWRVMADGTECEGESNDVDTIFIKELPEVTATNLTDAQRTFGSCQEINLGTLFNPQPAGGKYIRNGITLASAWSNVRHDTLEKIQYEIKSRGCSKIVGLGDLRFVDPPVGTMTTDSKMLCPLMGTNVHLGASGAYPVRIEYMVTFIDNFNNTVYAPPMSPMSATYIVTAAGQKRSLAVTHRADLNGMIYKITRVEDKYGCTMKEEGLGCDTVSFSHVPKFFFESKYGGSTWRRGNASYIISAQDSVELRGILLKGDKPWNIMGYRAPRPDPNIQLPTKIAKDTANFWIKGPGYYVLNADNVWGCYSQLNDYDIFIQHADTGYIKLMAYLEGPWDSLSGKMVSQILPLIDKGSLSAWPVVAPKKIIDWVTMEVWTANLKLCHTQRCILLDDGTIVDTIGNSVLALPSTVGINMTFHIVLRHRNHLPIMSKFVSETAGDIAKLRVNASSIDLTSMQKIHYPTSSTLGKHASRVESNPSIGGGGWALSAGEIAVKQQDPHIPQPRNRFITMVEANIVSLLLNPTSQTLNTTAQTIDYDINFNGLIEWPTWSGNVDDKLLDWVRCFRNRNKSSLAPEN